MSFMGPILGRICALAFLLALVTFALPDRAEAAPMDHGAHHSMNHDLDCGDCPSDDGRDATHMGHGCHCVSAACTPVLPPIGLGMTLRQPAEVLEPAIVFDATALASVDPPPRPPRA
jgi:hypothetical protein